MCEESLASRRKPFPLRGDARREMEGGEGLSSLFFATELFSDARERARARDRDRERERRDENHEREAFLPVSPRDGISVARERARGRERWLEKEER